MFSLNLFPFFRNQRSFETTRAGKSILAETELTLVIFVGVGATVY
jgi:hypothetical protein